MARNLVLPEKAEGFYPGTDTVAAVLKDQGDLATSDGDDGPEQT
ncbi:MAG TPA: hypothetical protein VGK74_08920 [Symbiobacteriaceae bacterium]